MASNPGVIPVNCTAELSFLKLEAGPLHMAPSVTPWVFVTPRSMGWGSPNFPGKEAGEGAAMSC